MTPSDFNLILAGLAVLVTAYTAWFNWHHEPERKKARYARWRKRNGYPE